MLPVHYQAEILQLHFAEHLSFRMIAKLLGIDRKTVAEVVGRRSVLADPQQRTPRASMLAPYYPLIDKLLDDAPNRSAVNILQRLRAAGYLGGITILRDYLRSIRPDSPAEAFFRLEFAPGEAAQVDWGEFGDAFSDGTQVHAFVMVLCWSRMLYLEFTLRETLPALLRCYERALRFFGGLCREYWHDNMPTVVVERIRRLVRFTPKFLAYAGFHGFKPIVCNVGRGNEKGRVEDGVKLVRHQFWPGRHFCNLDDLNHQALEWRDSFANRREHAATGKVPELLLATERQALLSLRPEPYDTDDLVTCKVSPDFRVRFDTNTYSVPWTLTGRPVTVRGDDDEVRVYYAQQLVARHRRCYQQRQDFENPAHSAGLRERKPGASHRWDVEAVRSFGPHARRYLELLTAGRRSLRAELRELLCLATVYGIEPLEETIGLLLAQGRVLPAARKCRILAVTRTCTEEGCGNCRACRRMWKDRGKRGRPSAGRAALPAALPQPPWKTRQTGFPIVAWKAGPKTAHLPTVPPTPTTTIFSREPAHAGRAVHHQETAFSESR